LFKRSHKYFIAAQTIEFQSLERDSVCSSPEPDTPNPPARQFQSLERDSVCSSQDDWVYHAQTGSFNLLSEILFVQAKGSFHGPRTIKIVSIS